MNLLSTTRDAFRRYRVLKLIFWAISDNRYQKYKPNHNGNSVHVSRRNQIVQNIHKITDKGMILSIEG